MVKTISTTEARANFGDVLSSVYYTKEPVVVQKKGKVVAAIISPDEFERFQQQVIEQAWTILQAVGERNADKDPDEVLRDVTEEVEAVRREIFAERHGR